jgi:hypothetical protein
MTNKKLLYFAMAGIVIILFLLSLLLLGPNPGPGTGTGAKIDISTPQGAVTVNDVTQHPVKEVEDTVVVEENKQYSIIYFKSEKTFSITILSTPAQESRTAAESAFLKDLGVNFSGACKLSVSTFVPFDVDQNLAGVDFGLSFCQSGRQF